MFQEESTKVAVDVENHHPSKSNNEASSSFHSAFDDDDNDHDDEDDMAPLVSKSTVSPLELDSLRQPRRQVLRSQENSSSIGRGLRTMVMVVVGVIFVAAMFASSRSKGHKKQQQPQQHHHDHNHNHDHSHDDMDNVDSLFEGAEHNKTTSSSSFLGTQNETEIQTLESERDSVVDGCEPESSFNELMKKMEELEQISEDLCIEKPDNLKGPCKCKNPTIPSELDMSPFILNRWKITMNITKEIAKNATLEMDDKLDVVLLGDSITEHWRGCSLGRKTDELTGHAKVYDELFDKKSGGKINGLSLGISAERTENVLYRLQNGGMGELDPEIWWLLIGTNDLGGEWCSAESIVTGNIAIVQEILTYRPNSWVVINSLLPRPPFYWQFLAKANERLQCYADVTKKVEFFNATDIFMETNGTLKYEIMPDGLHPSAEGHAIWGTAIVDKVLELIQLKKEKEQVGA